MEIHQGRDKDSYIKSLEKVKSIQKSPPKTPKSPPKAPKVKSRSSASKTRKDPRFELIQQGKRKPSRKRRTKST